MTIPKITSYVFTFFLNIIGSIIDENKDEVDREITAIGTEILIDSKKKTQCKATTIPIINNWNILYRTRLHIIKSTINELRSKKNKIFLLSHFGRPKGQFNKKYSLKFLTKILADILSIKQIFHVNVGKKLDLITAIFILLAKSNSSLVVCQ